MPSRAGTRTGRGCTFSSSPETIDRPARSRSAHVSISSDFFRADLSCELQDVGLACDKICPSFHQAASLLKKLGSLVRCLDLIRERVGKSGFGPISGKAGALGRPGTEGRSHAVDRRAGAASDTQHFRERGVAQRLLLETGKSGSPASNRRPLIRSHIEASWNRLESRATARRMC